ncbi:MAG: nitroreductase [Pseudolabrys sp.]
MAHLCARRREARGAYRSSGRARERTAERRGRQLSHLSRSEVEPYRTRAFKVGEMLYESIGVARADKPGRYRQYARNYQFFGAPVGLFVATETSFGVAQWADIGGYLQTVMLLARDYGLHTCPQQAWVAFHKTVRAHLDLPDGWMVYSGLAMGYEDPDAPINRWRTPREPLESFAVFDGFPG